MPLHDGSGDNSYYEDECESLRWSASATESFTRAVNKLLKRFTSTPRTDDEDDVQYSHPSHRSTRLPQPPPVFLPPPPMAYRTTTTFTQYRGGAVEHKEYSPIPISPMHVLHHPAIGPFHQELPPAVPPTFSHEISPYPVYYQHHHHQSPYYSVPVSYHPHHPPSPCGYSCGGECLSSFPPHVFPPPKPPPVSWAYVSHQPPLPPPTTFFACEEQFPTSSRIDPAFYGLDDSYCEESCSYDPDDYLRQSQLPQETQTVVIEEEVEEEPVPSRPRVIQPLPLINDKKKKNSKSPNKSKLTDEEETSGKSDLLPFLEDQHSEENVRTIIQEHLNLLKDFSSIHFQEGHCSLRSVLSSYSESPVMKEFLPRLAALLIATLQSRQTQVNVEGIRTVKVAFCTLGSRLDTSLAKLGELLFLKTAPAVKFIRDEAEAALEASVRHCSPPKVVSCLFSTKYGGMHINTRIRKVAARLVIIFVQEVVGPEDTLNLYGKELTPLLVQWLEEPDFELRESAKKALHNLTSFSYAFQTSLKLHIDKDKLPHVKKMLNKLFDLDNSKKGSGFKSILNFVKK